MKIRPLPKILQEKAENELNEIPNQLEQNLEHFKGWLSKQVHLKYRNDDQLLVNFLRGSKFSLQRAKEKIDAFYTYRTLVPEIAQNLDPHIPPIQKHLNLGICVPLPIPKENPASPRVILARSGNYDPDELTLIHMCKGAIMTCDILFNDDDHYIVSGVIIIWDMKGLQFKTATQATPMLIKNAVLFYEKVFPTRVKAFYFINVPSFMERVLNIGKLLLSKKLANRLHFHSTNGWEAIYKNIPKSCFPNEFGGEGGCLDDILDEWLKTVESHRERLVDENNYCSDESKRPNKFNNISNFFGMEGSFRKLEID